MKNVLVIGGGGREHALAHQISRSRGVGRIYAAPGNPGMDYVAEPVTGLGDYTAMADFAEKNNIDLTIVGPEDPLAGGIVDLFRERDLPIVGPTGAATSLESSKGFAKYVMTHAHVRTAPYFFTNDYDNATGFIDKNFNRDNRWVIKADGLAKGKGVTVCKHKTDAMRALHETMLERKFGSAGAEVVVERMLRGPEYSVIAFVDGTEARFFPAAQDYKPLLDEDMGSNTGGMGAYSPIPHLPPSVAKKIQVDAMYPVLEEMKKMGMPMNGFLYGALMGTSEGPSVLEFNVRMGDPEAQPLLKRMRSDILPYLEACANGTLADTQTMEFDTRFAVGVVLASKGYPVKPEKGKLITGLDDVGREFGDDVTVFHAGTRREEGKIYTSGGRVICVTALGDTLDDAADLAYEAAGMIDFDGKTFRKDIARNVEERGKIR